MKMRKFSTWESVSKASLEAYGGRHSKVGSAVVEFIDLLQRREMNVPLAVPSKVGHDNIGLLASRPLNKGESVLSIPRSVWQPHSALASLDNFKLIGERMGSLENEIVVIRYHPLSRLAIKN